MSTEQLKKDIGKKFEERLRQACLDHVALCQAADISPEDAASLMFAEIGCFYARGLAHFTKMTAEDFSESMTKIFIMSKKAESERQG